MTAASMLPVSLLEETLENNLDRYPVAVLEDAQVPCDGQRSLRAMLPHLPLEALAHILDNAIWLDAPLAPVAKPAPGTPRSLVLALHAEDGFAAMSGYLLNRRGLSDCTYVVLAHPSYARAGQPPGATQQTLRRRDEASLLASITGVKPLWVNLSPKPGEPLPGAPLAPVLYDLIRQHDPSDIFIPAPLGKDPDRARLFEAAMRLFAGGYFKDAGFHVYESFPGADNHIQIDDFLAATENRYIRLQPWLEPIAESFDCKRQIARLMPGGEAAILKVASRSGSLLGRGDDYSERFWTLQLTFGGG